MQNHREKHEWGGGAHSLETVCEQTVHEDIKKKPHTQTPNHKFNHLPKHKNKQQQNLTHQFCRKNIQNIKYNIGKKAQPLDII